ncbi:MAG TPA: hypothetical protein VIW24_24915 [Aldersonia sp.]
MNAVKIFIGFAPFILFAVLVEHLGVDHVALAAVASGLVAAGLAGYEAVRGRTVKILDWAGIGVFGAIALVGFVGGLGVDEWLAQYGANVSTLTLAAVMGVSALTVPFTEQFARESVDRRYWGSPVFRAKNKTITWIWAGSVAAIGVAGLVANLLPATGVLDAVLDWLVPVAAVVFAVGQTKRIAAVDGERVAR